MTGEAALFTTVMLIIHGLLAVALLGAITHQTISVYAPVVKRTGSFVSSLRSVPSSTYTNVIVVLFVLTAIMGSIVYPDYRVNVRTMLQDYRMFKAEGAFEVKEHIIAIALGLLPAYWLYWRQPLAAQYPKTRAALTAFLCVAVWYGFLAGHILNNIRGFGT